MLRDALLKRRSRAVASPRSAWTKRTPGGTEARELAQLKGRFEVEELTAAKVKGKEKPLRIYNVLRANTKVQVPAGFVAEPTSAVIPT